MEKTKIADDFLSFIENTERNNELITKFIKDENDYTEPITMDELNNTIIDNLEAQLELQNLQIKSLKKQIKLYQL